MVSHKVQLLASLLLISEVYTQCPGRYGYGQQNGRLQSPTPGQFIIPAIIKPCTKPCAPCQLPNTPKLSNDVIIDRLIRLLICDIIEKDNVEVDVDVKEGKKNVDVKEGKKNVDVKVEKKNDGPSECKEPEICVYISPCNC